ncbi:Hpt domain-containing protein [Natronospirillum operosum]|uniref:Hpt domain-containing protein n=1 Tax=Natronospirillum operosum TaxID=2759953 RepID=A0A4Z0WCN3_9GAMM|nr:Hpt domain-containing protein [Natronospirillum operosum]TGG95972.1 Hpt domain-containing protein [Natronospirillum operosum]
MTTTTLDAAVLAELQLIMGDDFALLLQTFSDDSVQRLQALEATREDVDALRRAAHSFKGSASNVGAVALARSCLELENYCQQCLHAGQSLDAAHTERLLAVVRDRLSATREVLAARFPAD